MNNIFSLINDKFVQERKAIDEEKVAKKTKNIYYFSGKGTLNSSEFLKSVANINIEFIEKLYKRYLEIAFSYIKVLDTTKNRVMQEANDLIGREWLKLEDEIKDAKTRGRAQINYELPSKLEEFFEDVKRRIRIEEGERNLKFKQPVNHKSETFSNYAQNKNIFLAHSFGEEALIEILKDSITTSGYNWKEGKREDLGSISEDILSKIKNCGFFLVVMTKRDELKKGGFTTSSWLIEEKGASLAYGHIPLIMVEEGVDEFYVGFLQSDAQRISFDRSNFNNKTNEAIQMLDKTYKKHNPS